MTVPAAPVAVRIALGGAGAGAAGDYAGGEGDVQGAGGGQHERRNGHGRRNRRDDLNNRCPNRSGRLFEAQLAGGARRRDQSNGTLSGASVRSE